MPDSSTDSVSASNDPEGRADGPPQRGNERRPGQAPARRPSARRLITVVIVALLLAGAVVAHLLTGPGLSH